MLHSTAVLKEQATRPRVLLWGHKPAFRRFQTFVCSQPKTRHYHAPLGYGTLLGDQIVDFNRSYQAKPQKSERHLGALEEGVSSNKCAIASKAS
jgi:hypothetical protein